MIEFAKFLARVIAICIAAIVFNHTYGHAAGHSTFLAGNASSIFVVLQVLNLWWYMFHIMHRSKTLQTHRN